MILSILKIIAAIASLLFGLVALWTPEQTAGSAFLKADSPNGKAEIRASWGGMFIGLAIAVLFLRTQDAYIVFGIAYAATAVVRLGTWALDKSLPNRMVLIILAFEIVSAILFILPEGLF